MRVNCEDGAAAWPWGTQVVSSGQGAGTQTDYTTGVMALTESFFLSFFFLALISGDKKASLASVLPSSTYSAVEKASLPGILLCCSMCQHIERPPWLGSYSADQCIWHWKEHPEWDSTLVWCIRHLKEDPGWCPALHFSVFSIWWVSLTLVVTADASMWGERGYGDCSTPYMWLGVIALLSWLPGFPPQAYPTTVSSFTHPLSISP